MMIINLHISVTVSVSSAVVVSAKAILAISLAASSTYVSVQQTVSMKRKEYL